MRVGVKQEEIFIYTFHTLTVSHVSYRWFIENVGLILKVFLLAVWLKYNGKKKTSSGFLAAVARICA